ncbi:MAG: AmmeMemoRadiSam system radical SAM enzyme [candidate division WOR-3 bacterium]|nr:AmmeMemoRadiSam system radical SAM enzyme [candidate division WOR-3 bacterium]
MFYEKLKSREVRCHLCGWDSVLPKGCIIQEGKTGICGVRKNIDGKLYSLVYDKISSIAVHKVERKPLYHFAPGSKAYSICTQGCNWKCKYCQNWQLSQGEITGEKISPSDLVKRAKALNCQGLSYTFTEPTIFYELTYDTAKIAHNEGLYNTYVTNGYLQPEPIKKIAPYLDAVSANFKGSGDKEFLRKFVGVPSPKPIYKALEEFKKNNIHIEITDLIVPGIGDSMEKVMELVNWVKDNLGIETPIHFLRFFPYHKITSLPPTPIETLEQAYKIAKDSGMEYVYLGNVLDSKNNTYCPNCGALLIKRGIMETLQINLKDSQCPECGKEINIKGMEWIT